MSWCSKQDAQSHTHRAHPHTHSVADKTLMTLVQWCVTARVQPPFFVGMGAVKDHEANATLTLLNLENNRVGGAGATALADALQAAV